MQKKTYEINIDKLIYSFENNTNLNVNEYIKETYYFDKFSFEKLNFYFYQLYNFDCFSRENKLLDMVKTGVKFLFELIKKVFQFISNGLKFLKNFVFSMFNMIKQQFSKIRIKSKENTELYDKIENVTVKIHDWIDKENLFKPFDFWKQNEIKRINSFLEYFEIANKDELAVLNQIKEKIISKKIMFVDHSTIKYSYRDKNSKNPYFSTALYSYLKTKFSENELEKMFETIENSSLNKCIGSLMSMQDAYEDMLTSLDIDSEDVESLNNKLNIDKFYYINGNRNKIIEYNLKSLLILDTSVNVNNYNLLKNFEKIIDEKLKEFKSYDIDSLEKLISEAQKSINRISKECEEYEKKVANGDKIDKDEFHRLLIKNGSIGEMTVINAFDSFKAHVIHVFVTIVKDSNIHFLNLSKDCTNIVSTLSQYGVTL